MNEFIVPEAGEYRLWTYDPGRQEIRVRIDGVPCQTASSTLGLYGEAKIEIILELAKGTVITTEPGNAPFVVRTLDGKVVYDTTGEAALRPAARPFLPWGTTEIRANPAMG
jgi:hypothetical protein